MNSKLYLQSWAALHAGGIDAAGKPRQPWEANQRGPLDLRRDQVFDQMFPTFGKLRPAEKLAFGVSSLIYASITGAGREQTGVSLGTIFGSLSTDLRYVESVVSGTPRPALFSATLPSSPVAEAAIQFGLKGPNRVTCGPGAGYTALDLAMRIVADGKAPAMLVLIINALDDVDCTQVCTDSGTEPFACGLLVGAAPLQKQAAWRIGLRGEFRAPDKVSSQASSQSYFLNILTALQQGENRACPIAEPDFNGTLWVEKDLEWKN
jgi:hypothetical protein